MTETTMAERLRGAADALEHEIAKALQRDPDRDVSEGRWRVQDLREAADRAEREPYIHCMNCGHGIPHSPECQHPRCQCSRFDRCGCQQHN